MNSNKRSAMNQSSGSDTWFFRALAGGGVALALALAGALGCSGDDDGSGEDDGAETADEGGTETGDQGSEPPDMDELFPDPGSITVDGETHEVERIHCRRMIRDNDLSVEMTGFIGDTGQERLYRARIDLGDHNDDSDLELAFHDPDSDSDYEVSARERDHGWQPWEDELEAFEFSVEDGWATGTIPMMEVDHLDPEFESEETIDAEVRIPVPEDHDLCAR